MAIYANSLALSKYMSYIENIDIKTKFKPTLEGFMVAAIDDALGNIYLKSESTEKVKALLTAFGVDLKVAREKLVQHMSTYDYVLEDTEKIKELKRKIRNDEKYLSAEEFLPEMLVERIFSEPTDAIKNAFSSPKTEADSKKDEIEAALDDLLKKKPTADPDTPSEGDGKPKVAAAPIEVLPDEVEPMDPKQFLNDLTVKVNNYHMFSCHYVIFYTAGFNDNKTFFSVDTADVTPGKCNKIIFRKKEVSLQNFFF